MEASALNFLIWVGIFFCISQAGILSGLNLALLGVSRLRLEVEAQSKNPYALKILTLRKDVNFLLVTILWANVGINVLLTLLSGSVMTGVTAFVFSTILITIMGEIVPQAYFSRHAMRIGAFFSPLIHFYQFLLYPIAKPSALLLDFFLGQEGINYFREQDFHTVIRKHIESSQSDVCHTEGVGAINFLKLDDIAVADLGEKLDPDSVIMLPTKKNKVIFPYFQCDINDPFLGRIHRSGKKWVIIVDDKNLPCLALNANRFLRDLFFYKKAIAPLHYCHRPIIVHDLKTLVGNVLNSFKVHAFTKDNDVIENDLIIVWATEKRVITGTDILGRLLRGIASVEIN